MQYNKLSLNMKQLILIGEKAPLLKLEPLFD